ncbi:Cuticle protein 19 [Pseudolycoriella hygida]|uniref:Cuticle protein 19 n=1 Tax=Pseudolycoriella hygida TaxID=35572 RepID=A0A9Q0NH24_9DIPT|nr:Cuticle protein 19 [Pseudolycoriella hygida]
MEQKFIMEFLSILLISFTIGSSIPAAVSEESNEPSAMNPDRNISSQPKEMQRYIEDLRKQKPMDTVTMKKYIKAYSTQHEEYQRSEETESDKIAKQNNDTIRLHPELIPFEISDAKDPDSETLKLIEKSKEEQQNDSTKERKKVKKDMSTAESIMIKITHPGPVIANRPRSLQQLPLEVQNAINFFVQKENSQKLSSSLYQAYKDKTSTQLSKAEWYPLYLNSQKVSAPLVLSPQLVNFPLTSKYSLAKPSLHTKLPQLQSPKPVNVLYSYKANYPVYVAPKVNVLKEPKFGTPVLPEKLITNGDQNLVDLTSLVDQPPDIQLKGLSEILDKPLIRPQDSTAPVLFPLGARLPKPRPSTDKPLFVVNAVTHSTTTSAPEATPKTFHYNEIKPFYKSALSLIPTYFRTKDHIPISENSPDNFHNKADISVVSPRPIYVAPIQGKAIEAKSFQQFKHPADPFQYASGYAFGYRVRDSHTGNDYGHTQNRDTDGITRGEYHIRLPDGRIQNVKYTADEKGFHADEILSKMSNCRLQPVVNILEGFKNERTELANSDQFPLTKVRIENMHTSREQT